MARLDKIMLHCDVGVAQLVEWLLPIPENHSSNPVITKIYSEHISL